jgi:hypothetical protein
MKMAQEDSTRGQHWGWYEGTKNALFKPFAAAEVVHQSVGAVAPRLSVVVERVSACHYHQVAQDAGHVHRPSQP